jgi:hypothetical protein
MTRGILIAGNESSLFAAAAAEALKRAESFASVLIPNRFTLPERGNVPPVKPEAGEGAIPLSWNPASPISARTVVLAAENRLGQINDAILVCSPPAVFKTAEALLPEEIDFFVNDQIKGWFFLVRELILYFRRFGSGSMSLVVPEINHDGKNAQTELLGASAAASFRTFAQSTIAASVNEPFLLTGFTGSEAGTEREFADWLFKIVDEQARKNRGRWLKFSKLKFFR